MPSNALNSHGHLQASPGYPHSLPFVNDYELPRSLNYRQPVVVLCGLCLASQATFDMDNGQRKRRAKFSSSVIRPYR
jgi:hypothetical protein